MKKTYWIIWFVVVLHLVQGGLLLVDKTAGFTTSAHMLIVYIPFAPLAGLVMLVAAIMAMVELIWLHPSTKLRMHTYLNSRYLVFLLPQQIILLMAAGSAIEAMLSGHFADGVIRSRAFIIADQSTYVLVAIFYNLAIIEAYVPEALPWNFLRKT